MKKEELIVGETYFISHPNLSNDYIELYDINKYPYIRIKKGSGGLAFYCYYYYCFSYDGVVVRLATPEEKHWLNECIKADKFIPLEEAIKSFNKILTINPYEI